MSKRRNKKSTPSNETLDLESIPDLIEPVSIRQDKVVANVRDTFATKALPKLKVIIVVNDTKSLQQANGIKHLLTSSGVRSTIYTKDGEPLKGTMRATNEQLANSYSSSCGVLFLCSANIEDIQKVVASGRCVIVTPSYNGSSQFYIHTLPTVTTHQIGDSIKSLLNGYSHKTIEILTHMQVTETITL